MSEPFLWGSQINLPAGVLDPHVATLRNGTFLVVGRIGNDWPDTKMRAWIYHADGSLAREHVLTFPDGVVPPTMRPEAGLNLGKGDSKLLAVELPDGRLSLTWTEHRESSDGLYVGPWTGIYNADLTPSGQPVLVLDSPASERYYAQSVASLGDGRTVVASSSMQGKAYVRILNPDGTRSDVLEVPAINASEYDPVADVTVLDGGKVAFTVREGSSSFKGYVIAPSGPTGLSVSHTFAIDPIVAPVHAEIEMTALRGGGFVVTWVESGKIDASGSEPSITVRFQVFDAHGTKVAGPAVFYASNQDAGAVGTPDVVALPGGGFALAAQVVPNNVPMNSEVRLAIFDAQGGRVSDKLLVSPPAADGRFSLIGLSLLADGRIAAHVSNGIQIVDPRDKAIAMNGTANNDHYIGTAFNDTFDGGAGADRLEGAGGNDAYVVDNAGDQVIEKPDDGIDTILTSLSYALNAHVEHLTATGAAAIALTGNELANAITGNAGANLLSGGSGNDTLLGGLGDDTLDGGAGADSLDGGDGFDLVSYMSASSGVTANLSRGAGDDFKGIEGLLGSSFGDVLTGSGSALLRGGRGDDTYVVGDADIVDEAGHEGRDIAIANGSYALKLDSEVEVLRLDGVSSTSSVDLTGSDTANEIVGHGGANSLRGLGGNDRLRASSGADRLSGDTGNDTLQGGAGNDKLYGGTGKDVFVFDTALSRTKNVDRLYDFDPRYDVIHLENRIFTKLGKGSAAGLKLKSDLFVKGKAAKDKEDRIVYDNKTGALYYDPDGTGSRSQVKVATLNKNLKVGTGDFFVI